MLRRQTSFRRFCLTVCAAGALMLAGCSSESRKSDRQNPFYRQGLKLQEEQRFPEAAEAFEKCLRHAPGSVLAHLQLAMLYEDRLDEPVQALYHYNRYLAKGGSSAPMAQESVARLQNRLARRWAETHPSLRDALTHQLGLVAESTHEAPPDGDGGPTEREQHLMNSIRQLSRLVRHLQDRLEAAQGHAGAPAAVEASPPETGNKARSHAQDTAPAEERFYTVRPGDTLTTIAERLYGASALWPHLEAWNADTIPDRNRLMPGMRLRVPALDQLRDGRPPDNADSETSK